MARELAGSSGDGPPEHPVKHPAEHPDGPAVVAERLCGRPVHAAVPVGGGGNNRLYRIETAGGDRFALKCYGPADARGDRLGREFDGLGFLAAAGETALPAAMAVDRERRTALYQWIDGKPARPELPGDIDQALALVRRLHRISRDRGQDWTGQAAEACLSARELLEQIDGRYARLAALNGEPALAAFLAGEFGPALKRARTRLTELYAAAGLDPACAIAPGARILSPSDFGFHNALRRPDGTLIFVDFEYFGWDDPVKLTADVLWHPGMTLSPAAASRWTGGSLALFGDDPAFAVRLAAQKPLYALRWCLIILNEFLPDRWQRRLYAGGDAAGWTLAKAAQLAKARALLERAGNAGSNAGADDPTRLPPIPCCPP